MLRIRIHKKLLQTWIFLDILSPPPSQLPPFFIAPCKSRQSLSHQHWFKINLMHEKCFKIIRHPINFPPFFRIIKSQQILFYANRVKIWNTINYGRFSKLCWTCTHHQYLSGKESSDGKKWEEKIFYAAKVHKSTFITTHWTRQKKLRLDFLRFFRLYAHLPVSHFLLYVIGVKSIES